MEGFWQNIKIKTNHFRNGLRYRFRYDKKFRWGSAIMSAMLIVAVIFSLLPGSQPGALAGTYTWMQNAWNGGPDTVNPATQSGWTKYYSKDGNITAGASGVTLASTGGSTQHTSDADFSGGTNSSTAVASNSVWLSQISQNYALVQTNNSTTTPTAPSNLTGGFNNSGNVKSNTEVLPSGTGGEDAGVVLSSETITDTKNYTDGTLQAWAVPSSISSVSVEVAGGKGGAATLSGGSGGKVNTVLAPVSGNIYYSVGGQGGQGSTVGLGGSNGGGGGSGYDTAYAGAGGGSSDIRIGGTAVSNRVVVAGGGGGGGSTGTYSGSCGGGAGATTIDPNSTGADGGCNSSDSDRGRGGGGGDVGGAGGTYGGTTWRGASGTAGSSATGIGGLGGGGYNVTGGGGGGGGGGYVGGGGGGGGGHNEHPPGGGGGGGGGSNYCNPSYCSSPTYANNSDDAGYIKFVYTGYTSGSYTSYLDGGAAVSYTWNSFSWSQTPNDGNIDMAVKITNSATPPADFSTGVCTSLGVTGTSGSITLTDSCGYTGSGQKYIWYKATLNPSADQSETPSLDSVTANVSQIFYQSSGSYISPTINTGQNTINGSTTLGWGYTPNTYGSVKMLVNSSNETYSDNFDGASLNGSKWSTGGVGTFTQSGGKIRVSSTGGSWSFPYIANSRTFSGDFDVQVDYDASSWTGTPAVDDWNGDLLVTIGSHDYNNYIERKTNGTNRYNCWDSYLNNGGCTNPLRTQTTGKLRATRSGTTLKFYVLDSSTGGWLNTYTFTNAAVGGNATIKLAATNRSNTTQPIYVDYDNFIVWGNNSSDTTGAWFGPDGVAHTDCAGSNCYATSAGQSLHSVHNGSQYFRYKAFLATTNTGYTPTLDSATLNYSYYADYSQGTLTSSAFNTTDSKNKVSDFYWTGTETAGTDVKFQVRTAPDSGSNTPGTWSGWCGATTCDGASYYDPAVNSGAGITDIIASQEDRSGDQWVQYKMFLTPKSDGAAAPTVTEVNLKYNFNNAATLVASGTTQSGGNALVNYTILDPDVTEYAPQGSQNVQLGYQMPGVTLKSTDVTANSGDIDDIILHNINSTPFTIPAANPSYIFIDNELIKYTGVTNNGTTAVTLTGITRAQNFATSPITYPTAAAAHTGHATVPALGVAVYFQATQVSGTGAGTVSVTTGAVAKTITWNAKSEPQIGAANITGNSFTGANKINLKVFANDGFTDAGLPVNNIGIISPTAVDLDFQAPSVAITYSSNPAKAGVVTVTATYSENVKASETPQISINQPGSTDITNVNMTVGADRAHWTYAYTVNAANGSTYIDGSATVALSTNHDEAGNTAGAPTGTTFTIDTTPPTASLAYSTSNLVKSGDVLRITATFNGPMADSPAPKIAITGNNTLTATAMTKTDATHYYYDHTVGVGNGTATVALSIGTDLAGNVITSAPTSGATFTVDNTLPIVSLFQVNNMAENSGFEIDSNTDGYPDSWSSASYASRSADSFSGNYALSIGYNGGAWAGIAQQKNYGSYSVGTNYTLSFRYKCAAGAGNGSYFLGDNVNYGKWSKSGSAGSCTGGWNAFSTTLYMDTDQPTNGTLSIYLYGQNATSGVIYDNVQLEKSSSASPYMTHANSQTVKLYGTSSSSDAAEIQFSNNGTNWGKATSADGTISDSGWLAYSANSGTSWNVSSTNETKTISYRVRDAAGNVSSPVSTAQIILDTQVPVISAVSPATDGKINSVTSASDISYTLSEAVQSGSIVFTRTGGTADASSPRTCMLKGTALNSNAHANINLSDTTNSCVSPVSLVDGTVYTMAINATDAAGNPATAVTSTNVTFDTSAPSSLATALSTYQTAASFTLAWSGTDTGGAGIQNYDVQYKKNSGSWSNCLVSTTSTSITFPSGCADPDPTVANGDTFYFQVRAKDNAGNQEEYPVSADTQTTIDTTAPTDGTFTLKNATNGSADFINSTTVNVDSISATDATTEVSSMRFSDNAYSDDFEDNSLDLYNAGTNPTGKWTKSVANGSTIEEVSNKLTFTTSATHNPYAVSRKTFTGDFDVQFDFDASSWGTPSGSGYWQSNVFATIGSNAYYLQYTKTASGSKAYQNWSNDSGFTNAGVSTTQTSGKVRMVRTGTTLELFYYNNGWVRYKSYTSINISGDAILGVGPNKSVGDVFSTSIDNFIVWSGWEDNAATKTGYVLSSGTEGTRTAYASFKDAAGNVSPAYADTITYDTSAPSTPSVTDGGQYTNSTTQLSVSWTSADDQSGIAEYQYAISTSATDPGSNYVSDWASTGTTANATKDGLTLQNGTTYYFHVKAKNGAGGWSAVGNSDGITVDTDAPTGGSFTIKNGATATNSTSVTLNITCPTDNWGTIQFAFGNSADPNTGWADCAATQSHTLTAGDATKTVYMRFKDGGGNITATNSTDTIIYETAAPTSSLFQVNNILSDSSFESGGLAGWSYQDAPKGSAVNDSTKYYSGTKSLKITRTAAGGEANVWKGLTLKANTTYRYSAYAWADTANTACILAFNGSSDMQTTCHSGSGQWERLSGIFTTTSAGTIQPRLRHNSASLNSVYFDAVQIEEGSAAASTYMTYVSETNGLAKLYVIAADTGGSNLSKIQFSNDNTNWGKLDNGSLATEANNNWTSGYYYDFTSSPAVFDWKLSDNDELKTIYTRIQDAAGNVSVVNSISTTTTLDRSAPAVTLVTSVEEDSSAPYFDNSDNTSTAIVFPSPADTAFCRWHASDVAYDSMTGTQCATSGASTTCTTNLSGQGAKTVYIRCMDYAGNKAGSSQQVNYTIDSQAPTVNAGTDKTINAQFTQDATVTDASSLTYQWTKQSGPGTITFGSATSEDTTISANADGAYTIRLTVTDAAGNISNDEFTLTWDATAPTGSISIIEGNYTQSADINLTLSASDTGGSELYQMSFSNNGTDWSEGEPLPEPIATPKAYALPEGDGEKTVYVRFNDNAGNVSASYPATITLDQQAPAVSFADDVSATVTKDDTITINIAEVNPDTSQNKYVFSDDALCNTKNYSIDSFPYVSGTAFHITTETNNVKYICAQAVDMAGRVGYAASARTLNVDVTPPTTPTINTVATDDIINSTERTATVTVTGTKEAGSTVTLNGNATTADTATTWSYVLTADAINAFGQGAETLTAIATDLAGNVNVANGTKNITVDTAAPTLTSFTSDTPNGTYGANAEINIQARFDEALGSSSLTVVLADGANYEVPLASVSNAGGIYKISGTYTVQQTANRDHDTTDLNIALIKNVSVTDLAGNVATGTDISAISATQNLANNKALVIDTGGPILQNFSASTGSFKAGAAVTITANFSEALASGTMSVKINTGGAGSPATVVLDQRSGSSVSGTYTVQGDDNIDPVVLTDLDFINGTIVNVKDALVNQADTLASMPVSGTLSNTSLDNIEPVASFTNNVEAGPVQSDDVVIDVTETHAGSYKYIFSSDNLCSAKSDGTYAAGENFSSGGTISVVDESNNDNYLCVRVADLAGNKSYLSSAEKVDVDVTAPTADTIKLDRSADSNHLQFTGVVDKNADNTDNAHGIEGLKTRVQTLAGETTACDLSSSAYIDYAANVTLNDIGSVLKACVQFKDTAGNESQVYSTYTPENPDNFKATDISNLDLTPDFRGVFLTWQIPVVLGAGGIDYFELKNCSTTSDQPNCSPDTVLKTIAYAVPVTNYDYSHNNLIENTKYCYNVRFKDLNGNYSKYSSTKCIVPGFGAGRLTSISLPPNPPSVLTDKKAVIMFDTDQAAKCVIAYGTMAGPENYTEVPVSEAEYNFNHAIHLPGLVFSTPYFYQITCEDAGRTVISSPEYNFTTLETQMTEAEADADEDVTAPEISSVSTTNVTGDSATVTWTTDEESNSLVKFGTASVDENMAGNATVNSDVANYVSSHSAIIRNLIPATKYLFQVISTDAASNIAQSSQSSFTTKAPSSLSAVKVVSKNLGQAIVTWETDQAATSIVEYGLTTAYDDNKQSGTKTKEHEITLAGLKAKTTYHFRVKGTDSDGNLYASSDNTFEPKSPPSIDNIKISDTTEHGAKIAFTTDVPTDALITYADLSDAENTGSQGKPELTSKHEIELKSLTSGTTYSLKIRVRDEMGNETEENFPNFTTGKDENAPKLDNIRTDSALAQSDKVQSIISWITDEPATTEIIYREGRAGQEKNFKVPGGHVTNHVAVITAFAPGKVYYFNVKSVDVSGNEAKSTDFALLTPKIKENIVQIIIGNFQDIFSWAKL